MDRNRWIAAVKPAVKWTLGLVVLVFVGRHIQRTWVDLHREGRSLHLDPTWLVVAVWLYLAGLAACGAYFARVVRSGPQPPGTFPAIRAYLISHLGKYVPGKAMVVVVRSGLLAGQGTRPATAAFASIYETLVMMAVGSAIAAIGFAMSPGSTLPVPIGSGRSIELPSFVVAAGLAGAFFAAVLPPVFRRLSALMRAPFRGVGPETLPQLSGGLLASGFAWTSPGWLLLGLSQVAVLRALLPGGVALSLWPAIVASVALATVAGFVVAVVPGGLGVREFVLWTALGSSIDQNMAVIAALVLRLTWVAGEVLAALVLGLYRPSSLRVAP